MCGTVETITGYYSRICLKVKHGTGFFDAPRREDARTSCRRLFLPEKTGFIPGETRQLRFRMRARFQFFLNVKQ
jgi:hypothetical protein